MVRKIPKRFAIDIKLFFRDSLGISLWDVVMTRCPVAFKQFVIVWKLLLQQSQSVVCKNSIVRQIRRLLSSGKCYLVMTRNLLGRSLRYPQGSLIFYRHGHLWTSYQVNKVSFSNLLNLLRNCFIIILHFQTLEFQNIFFPAIPDIVMNKPMLNDMYHLWTNQNCAVLCGTIQISALWWDKSLSRLCGLKTSPQLLLINELALCSLRYIWQKCIIKRVFKDLREENKMN